MTFDLDPRGRSARRLSRRGMAVLLVLLVLGISLAMAYGVMRVQSTAEQVQQNSIHRGDARQVALAGLSEGLRRMHETGWAGVGTSVAAALNVNDRYEVTYTTGDPDLTATPATVTDADVAAKPELLYYPFRVTVLSKGFSRDPGTGVEATHAVRAVVELAPGKLAAAPTNWDKVVAVASNYSVYQRGNDEFSVHMPMQIRGRVRIHGELDLNEDYTNWDNAASNYLAGLRDTFAGGGTDYRPFTGPIIWEVSRQTGTIISWISTRLGLTAIDAADATLGSWRSLAPNDTYRLYPGGKAYAVSAVGSSIGVGTLPEMRPLDNPLRIYYTANETQLGDNLTLRGLLVAEGTNGVTINGVNVQLEPLDLPKLGGQTAPVRLPTIVANQLTQPANKRGSIRGLASIDGDFTLASDTQAATFTLVGKLVAQRIRIRGRTEWDQDNWLTLVTAFNVFSLLDSQFPGWAQAVSIYHPSPEPKIVIRPDDDANSVTYHWITRGTPLYEEASSGLGLRWNIVSWKDSP